MTIQDFKDFDLDNFLSIEKYEYVKNLSYEEFKDEYRLWAWFYWEKVLVVENVIDLTNKQIITQEIQDLIFGNNGELFPEKFPACFPNQNKEEI